jgi:hypothetical protein
MSENLQYFVSGKVRIFGEWHQPGDVTKIPDINDPLVDPSALSIRIDKPDGTSETFVYGTDAEVVRDTLGKYHCDYIPEMEGTHTWIWLPTGNAAQPIRGQFYVHPI